MVTCIYGTCNAGKIQFMREVLKPIELHVMGIGDISLSLPNIDENGASPLENARIKALAYYKALREQTKLNYPLFSCDSGLYIDGLPEKEQPGIHIRRAGGISMTDEEMIDYYSSVAAQFGGKVIARYRNAICLVVSENERHDYMGDDIASSEFLLVTKPHSKRESGFPLNSLSVHIESGEYYNDLSIKPRNISQEGFRMFFKRVLVMKERDS
jgi:XTP/dITP diphosphohydrolase